ncbi:MAG: DUF2892 domain-containing protein [DPANN group archaeon]|nr:DUF2892 domain-containing protein [DPANN group archaeon]
MEKNVGNIDRNIRYVISALLLAYGFYYWIWWIIVIGGVLLLTAILGYCGPYKLLGIDTNKKR